MRFIWRGKPLAPWNRDRTTIIVGGVPGLHEGGSAAFVRWAPPVQQQHGHGHGCLGMHEAGPALNESGPHHHLNRFLPDRFPVLLGCLTPVLDTCLFRSESSLPLVCLWRSSRLSFGAYDPYLTSASRIPISRVSEGDRKWRRKHPEEPIAKACVVKRGKVTPYWG